MAGEIVFSFIPSKNCYFLIFDRNGKVWNASGGGAFETYATGNLLTYGVGVGQLGTASSFYKGDFPSNIPPGVYGISAKQQVGASPDESDKTISEGDYQWNGSFTLPLSDLATSGQLGQAIPIKIARGVAVPNFGIKMVSSTDHSTNFSSGVISGQIARDGGSFGPLQSGAFTEVGNGWYNLLALTSGDLLANTAKLMFTGTGVGGGTADQRDFFLILQRTSGQ